MSYERFVQVETGLRRSKLVDRMRDDLGDTPVATIVGCLTLLWSEALDLRTGGDLSERSDRWIEEVACWPGKAGAFAKAVRAHHLDEHGSIREWDQRYGKLDRERTKASKLKAEQRRRAREVGEGSGGQSEECPPDTHETEGGPTDDSPRIPSISLSVSRSDLALGEGEPERERAEERPDPDEHPAIVQVRERFGDYAEWPTALVRAARVPEAVAASLVAHLDGMHGPAYTAEVISLAAREWASSDDSAQGFKPRLFAGYVRRAEGTVKLTESRKQQQNETRFIRAEVARDDSIDREIAKVEADIARGAEVMPADEYARLSAEAEAKVPSQWSGRIRHSMVRAELARRVVIWLDNHGDGGARAAV